MWELEDWKDFSKMLTNFAEAGFALAAVFVLLSWLSRQKD